MLRLSLALSLVSVAGFGGHPGFRDVEPTDNVNSRYTVERVDLTGYASKSVSRGIRQRLNGMIGRNLDSTALDRIAARIRDELRVEEVRIRIGKGTRPLQVAVQLEIEHHHKAVDFNLSRIGYLSNEGPTAAVGINTEFAGNRASIAYLSDADQFIERASGFQGGFERTHLTRDSRVGLRINYGALSSQWNNDSVAAFAAAPTAARYGFRQYVEPELLVAITPQLQFSVGASVEHLENIENASMPRNLAANAVTGGLRYHSRFEGTAALTQDLDAGYTMRVATRALGSDFVYTRHSTTVTYALHHVRQTLRFKWAGGVVNGNAPIYDRFALGNSSTLRGWNKYAIAPLGGSRIAHGSVEYRYRMLEAFYDVGSIGDSLPAARVAAKGVKHSLGVGIRKDALQLAVAFPLKNGRLDPVFLAGVNF